MSTRTSDLAVASSPATLPVRSEGKREAEALFQKGNVLILGTKDRSPNYVKGVECYEAAAALGHPRAHAVLGLFYLFGLGVPWNPGLAQKYHRKAYQLGEPTAQYFEGDSHIIACDRFAELGWVIQFVTKIAHQIILKQESDKPGIVEAHFYLGLLFARHGKHDAKKWIRKAAELGHFKAQSFYEQYYTEREDRIAWCRKMIEWGNIEGYNALANLYKYRFDRDRAMELYREAARRGHLQAQRNYADMLIEDGNIPEARTWREVAAQQGYRHAQYEYAELLRREGRGASDRREALDWYSKAAEQGHELASRFLKTLSRESYLEESEDTKKAEEYFQRGNEYFKLKKQGNTWRDYERGVEAYTEAVRLGHARACSALMACHYIGVGVRQDSKRALEWHKEASARGDTLAECFNPEKGLHEVISINHAAWLIDFYTNITRHVVSNENTSENYAQVNSIREAHYYLAYLFHDKYKIGQEPGFESSEWKKKGDALALPLSKATESSSCEAEMIPMSGVAQLHQLFQSIKTCSIATEADRQVEAADRTVEREEGVRTRASLSASAPAKAAAPAKVADRPAATVESKVKKEKLGRTGVPMLARASAKSASMSTAAVASTKEVSIPALLLGMQHEMGPVQEKVKSLWQDFETHRSSLLKIFTERFKRLTIKKVKPTKNNRNEKKRTDFLKIALNDVAAFIQCIEYARQLHARIAGEINILRNECEKIHANLKSRGSDATASAAFESKLKQLQEKFKHVKGLPDKFEAECLNELRMWSSIWHKKVIEITHQADLDLAEQAKIQEKLHTLAMKQSSFNAALALLDNADPGEKAACLVREVEAKADRDAAMASASASGQSRGSAGAAAVAGVAQSDVAVPSSQDVVSESPDELKSALDQQESRASEARVVRAESPPLAKKPGETPSEYRLREFQAPYVRLEKEKKQKKQRALRAKALERIEKGESIPATPLTGGGSSDAGVAAPSAVAQGAGVPAVGAAASPVVFSNKHPKGVGAMPALVGATPDRAGDKMKLRDLEKLVEGLSKMVSEAAAAVEAKRLSEHALMNGQALVGVLSRVEVILEKRADREHMQKATEQLKVGLYQSVVEESEHLTEQALYGLILRWIAFVYEDDPNCDDESVIQKTFNDCPLFTTLLTKGPKDLSEVKRLREDASWETCVECIQECHAQLQVCAVELRESPPWLHEQRIKRRQEWLCLRLGTQLQLLMFGARKERDRDAVNALRTVEEAIEGFSVEAYKEAGIYTQHLRASERLAPVSEKPAAARPPFSRVR